jgi:hypothetical protein
MHFATRVRTWRVARLYSEIALSRKLFGIGHMYIYTFLLRMTDTMTSQNTDLSSWDILYIYIYTHEQCMYLECGSILREFVIVRYKIVTKVSVYTQILK